MWADCVCGYTGKQPITDGPYYLDSWTPGQGLVLKSNTSGTARTRRSRRSSGSSTRRSRPRSTRWTPARSTRPIRDSRSRRWRPDAPERYQPRHHRLHAGAHRRGVRSGRDRAGGTHSSNGAILLKHSWFDQALSMGMNRKDVANAIYHGVLPDNTVKPLNNPFYTIGGLSTEEVPVLRRSTTTREGHRPPKAHGCTGGPRSRAQQQRSGSAADHKAEINFYTTIAPARCSIARRRSGEQKAIGIELDTQCYTAQPDFFTNLLPTGAFDLAEYAFTGGLTRPDGTPSTSALPRQPADRTTRTTATTRSTGSSGMATQARLDEADGQLRGRGQDRVERRRDHPALCSALVPLLQERAQGTRHVEQPDQVGPLWNAEKWTGAVSSKTTLGRGTQ